MSEELTSYGDSSRKADVRTKGKPTKVQLKGCPAVIRRAKVKK